MRKATSFATLATLSLVLAAAVPLAAAAGKAGERGVARDEVDLQFNMTGQAVRTNGGPDGSFTFYANATGTGTRTTPQGNGVQIRADRLLAQIVVVNAEGTEVENYTAYLKFHASQASYLGKGLPGFKFQMQLVGKRSDSVVVNTANPDGRILSLNFHGDTVGNPDEDGVFALQGRGQTTTKDGASHGATHYNLFVGGTGSITKSG